MYLYLTSISWLQTILVSVCSRIYISPLSYRTIHFASFANYMAAHFRALVTFDCFVIMTTVSGNLLRGAWARIYNFTTYKARTLRSCTGQSHSCRRFEDSVVDPSPCFFHLILTIRAPATTSIKHRPIERTAKQLYTYFMEPDIVFRIAIVHATDLEIPIDNANVMIALGKYCSRTIRGYKWPTKSRKCLKDYKR